MSFNEKFPLEVYIRQVGKVYYPHLRAFMDEWDISYHKLCRVIYMNSEVEVENKKTKNKSSMRIELPRGWEAIVKYEEKNNQARRYQIRQC